MLKSILKFITCLGLLASSTTLTTPATNAAGYADGLAAVVGDEAITVYDVVKRSRSREKNLREQLSDEALKEQIQQVRKETARQMVNEKLLFLEAQKRDLQLPQKFINERLDRIVVSQAGGSYEKFKQMLSTQNMTLADYRQKLTQRLTAQVLVDQFVRRQVNVTRQDVKRYYEKNREDFRKKGSLHLRVIFLRKDESNPEAVTEEAQSIIQALEEGADFAELAEQHSDDPGSAAKGGDLGWIKTDTGRKAFVKAAQELEAGEVAEPVEQPEGVYILKLVDVKESKAPVLNAELRKKIRNQLEEKRFRERYDEFLSDLRQQYFVKLFYEAE
ncbi:MAG: peptidylprolyl isomerase [Lentisphaeria bacterium]